MSYAAICREDAPEYRPTAGDGEVARILRAVRRVFPGAKLREIRRVGRLAAATSPRRARRARKLGGPLPLV